jgi:hypothetical protein
MSPFRAQRDMRYEVYFSEHILEALTAVESANWDLASHIEGDSVELYRQGFETAMRAIAAAFGFCYSSPVVRTRASQPLLLSNSGSAD